MVVALERKRAGAYNTWLTPLDMQEENEAGNNGQTSHLNLPLPSNLSNLNLPLPCCL